MKTRQRWLIFIVCFFYYWGEGQIILNFHLDETVAPETRKAFIQPLEKEIQNLYRIFFPDHQASFTIHIHLIKTRAQWEKLFRKYSFVEWSSGVAFTRTNNIYILLEQEAWQEILETFTHEVVHILNHEKWKNFELPVWFDEGLAQYFSGKKLPLSELTYLSNFIVINKLIPFHEIENLYQMNEKAARLSYIEAYLAIKHFDDVLGHGSLHKLFSKNPVGFANFNNYFYSIFKISVDGFESKFFTLIKNKYKFLFILNLENFIFLIAILLLFASYFVLRRKNKKRMEEMEENMSETGGME
jgi:hypothetical protein